MLINYVMKVISFCLLLVLAACTSEPNQDVLINGVLINYNSKIGVPNAKVFIELGSEVSGMNPETSIADGGTYFTNSVMDSAISNSLGRFSFKANIAKNKIYRFVTKDFVTLNMDYQVAKFLNAKQTTDSLLIGSASNLKLIVKRKDPKDGDAIQISATCLPANKIGFSRFCTFSIDNRVGSLPTTPKQNSIVFQFLSDVYKEATLNIAITKDQQTVSTTKVIPLKDKSTVEYVVEY